MDSVELGVAKSSIGHTVAQPVIRCNDASRERRYCAQHAANASEKEIPAMSAHQSLQSLNRPGTGICVSSSRAANTTKLINSNTKHVSERAEMKLTANRLNIA